MYFSHAFLQEIGGTVERFVIENKLKRKMTLQKQLKRQLLF